jgi:hypothetical protein
MYCFLYQPGSMTYKLSIELYEGLKILYGSTYYCYIFRKQLFYKFKMYELFDLPNQWVLPL